MDGKFHSYYDYFRAVELNRYDTYPWLWQWINALGRGMGCRRVLEIGPGHGTDLIQFAYRGWKTHAVDITPAHLNATVENFYSRGMKPPQVWERDAVDVDLLDIEFDLVFMNGVLHHIPEDRAVVEAVRDTLKRGGKFAFAVYNTYSWFRLYKALLRQPLWSVEEGAEASAPPYVRTYTMQQIRKLLGHDFIILNYTTECSSPLPDWVRCGGWFHVVEAVKR